MNVFADSAKNGSLPLVTEAVTVIVRDSFRDHPMRNVTQAEVRHRTNLVMRWVEKLCDLDGWTLDKALHCVGNALAAELDGSKWDPPASGFYPVKESIDHLTTRMRVMQRQAALQQ